MRKLVKQGFDRIERVLDRLFGADWNPLAQLGPLGWLMFWIVAVTGAYLFVFFDTGVNAAYKSIEWLAGDHWWHAGLARSLHRYASDLLVVLMFIHMLREWSMDRFRGRRWFSWVTGVPVIWFIYLSGITGYWLVWDSLAQYVALTSTELLDSLGIFAEPIARNFLSDQTLSSRFFTLMVFLHIAIPLLLLLFMSIHVQRITSARTKPPRGLASITLAALLLVAVFFPAGLQAQADLAKVPEIVGLDWFYLGLFPVIEHVPPGAIWAGAAFFTLALAGMPWLPARKEGGAAHVSLDFCNGCARCVADCPYSAITLVPRSDGLPFAHEVEVDPARCVACGICMGACPSSSPFRRSGDLVTGIDLPDRSLADVRAEVIRLAQDLEGNGRVLTIGCAHGAAGTQAAGRLVLPCVAMAPPSLVDYIISRDLADGVAIAGCPERDCYNRLGVQWTRQRLDGLRDPHFRARIPRERILTVWAGTSETRRLAGTLDDFSRALAAMPPYGKRRSLASEEEAAALAAARRAAE